MKESVPRTRLFRNRRNIRARQNAFQFDLAKGEDNKQRRKRSGLFNKRISESSKDHEQARRRRRKVVRLNTTSRINRNNNRSICMVSHGGGERYNLASKATVMSKSLAIKPAKGGFRPKKQFRRQARIPSMDAFGASFRSD